MKKITEIERYKLASEYVTKVVKEKSIMYGPETESIGNAFSIGLVYAIAVKQHVNTKTPVDMDMYIDNMSWSFFRCCGQLNERQAFVAGYKTALELK